MKLLGFMSTDFVLFFTVPPANFLLIAHFNLSKRMDSHIVLCNHNQFNYLTEVMRKGS